MGSEVGAFTGGGAMEITIGKAQRGQLSDPLSGQVYVGRPSPLGNPFQLGRDGSRAEVVACYRRWLWSRLQEPASSQRRELELLCWCAPLPCHAELIRSALHWLAEQEC